MKLKTGLIFIGVIIVLLFIKAATDSRLEKHRQTRDDEDVALQLKGEDNLVCTKQVKATVGEDVKLDCNLKLPRDVTAKMFEWKFGSQLVLVYRSRDFSPADQAPQFKVRAQPDSSTDLTVGKLPVKISSVQLKDAGTYSCSVGVRNDKISCSTELIVETKPEPTQGAVEKKVVQDPSRAPEHGHIGIGTGGIIGIVAVCIIGLAAVGLIYLLVRRCGRQRRRPRDEGDEEDKGDNETGQMISEV